MKRILCGLLCAVLVAGTALAAGCASRPADPTPEPASQSEPENASEPEEDAVEPAAETPSEPEESEEDAAPGPELSDSDKQIVEDWLHQFINYFGEVETYSAEGGALDREQELLFCLVQIFRQKDLLGYYFEQDDDGNYLIPESVVYDESARLLSNVMGFPTFDRYDEAAKAYRYKPGSEAKLPNYAVSDIHGGDGENVVYWDVDFFAADDASFKSPLRTSRYTFNLLRLNGMPYLQLVMIETK